MTKTGGHLPVHSRQLSADLVRIMAILFVVLIHTFHISVVDDFPSGISLGLFTLAKTGVPLFVMLSGALLLPKSEALSVFWRKRVQRVLVPWLFWAVILFILTALPRIISPFHALAEFRQIFISQFSFLPMLWCLYLLIPIFKIIVQRGQPRDAWYFVLLWFVGVSVLPFLRNSLAFPLSVDNGLVRQTLEYSGYLVLGWLLSQWQLSKVGLRFAIIIVLLCIIAATFLVGRGPELQLVYHSYISPLIVIASASVFLFCVSMDNWLRKLPTQWQKIIIVFSQASFGVYLVHPVIIKSVAINFSALPVSSLTKNFCSWLIVISFSFVLIMCLKKIAILKKMVG